MINRKIFYFGRLGKLSFCLIYWPIQFRHFWNGSKEIDFDESKYLKHILNLNLSVQTNTWMKTELKSAAKWQVNPLPIGKMEDIKSNKKKRDSNPVSQIIASEDRPQNSPIEKSRASPQTLEVEMRSKKYSHPGYQHSQSGSVSAPATGAAASRPYTFSPIYNPLDRLPR